MTWFHKIIDWLIVTIRLAILCTQSQLKPTGFRAFTKTIVSIPGDLYRLRYVGMTVFAPSIPGSHDQAGKGEFVQVSGTSRKSLKEATAKAFSEYLECLAVWKKGDNPELSRSGWAVALSRDKAIANAYAELIERDAFLTHFFVPSLSTQIITCPAGFETLNTRCVVLQSSDKNIVVVLVAIKGNINDSDCEPYYLGLGTGKNLNDALAKAIDECLVLRSEWQPKTWHDSDTSPRKQMYLRHWKSGSDKSIRSRLDQIFNGDSAHYIHNFETNKEKLNINYDCSFGDKFFVCSCSHLDLLPLTFGNSWDNSKDEIQARLYRRGFESMNWGVHPFI